MEDGTDGEPKERQKRSYKTTEQVKILLSEMEKMICEGQRDRDIMAFFELKERSYYYFKDKLYKQSLDLAKSRHEDSTLTFEGKLLKDRLSKIYQHLEQRLGMINRGECDDNISDVSTAAFNIAQALLKLELEGLRALAGINHNKFLKYANDYHQTISPNYYGPNDQNDTSVNSNVLRP